MGSIIFVTGLPGAGKTRYVQELAENLGAELFDDFKANAIDDNPSFNFGRYFSNLIDALRSGKTCIVSDIDFCRSESRAEAEVYIALMAPETSIEWRFFEKDLERCRRNIEQRAQIERRDIHKEHSNIEYYAQLYRIPPGGRLIKVWSPS
jgi:adenylate kinase family enzyme